MSTTSASRMFFVEVDTRGADARLGFLIGRLANPTRAMQVVAGALEDASEEAFATERSPSGVPWPDLAESTIKRRTRSGSWPGQKLQVSGQLAASVSSDFGEDFAEIGSNKVYAATQQLGRDEIPARAFLGFGDQEIADVEADILQFFLSESGI